MSQLPKPINLLSPPPTPGAGESVRTLFDSPEVRIETIVSHGHRSPDGFHYDQTEDEWVLLVSGRAALGFEGQADPVELGPGDCLLLPAHCRHRVEWTEPGVDTVWLAVYRRRAEVGGAS
jgi:cupin 2 domain-containing protein